MPLAPDTQIGPYKIIALIGAGGMGEVYRARDTRLLRDVALKVLPESFTAEAERVRRFEQEAHAVAALNHPNIVSIFDIGAQGQTHYIVSELLEGQTLRDSIPPSGMPMRRAVELAIQIANGLAAAHDQGIVHRDLKPENIFVTRDGRIKILDFGLAKLRKTRATSETLTSAETEVGQVLGTVGYMSPEQVKGEPADHRSDIFSFGSIFYEMLTGQRAFKRNTGAETMTAILNEEAPELTVKTGPLPATLERIVRHCMEKQPSRRFQSAHDIAFDLESLSGISGTVAAQVGTEGKQRRKPLLAAALVLGALLLGAVGTAAWMRSTVVESHPKLHRITFRRGIIWNARFTPDGNLTYSAAWEGKPTQIFEAQPGSTESRSFEMAQANLLSVSGSGELAVALKQEFAGGFEYTGMLARAPKGGGAPREILDNVEYADWSADGSSFAVARRILGKPRLEYPIGKVVYETPGWISHLRISPDGEFVAFADHPYVGDDGGSIAIIDRQGKKKTLSGQYVSLQGLAWAPTGKEVWFTGTTSGSSRELRAVTLDGKERLVYLGTGTLTLYDIAKDGKVLFTRDDFRAGMVGMGPGATKEIELSWHDFTIPRDISNDGKLLSFDESGEAGGETGALYIRGMDGSPAVRLGDGLSPTLSPDGKWVLAMVPQASGERRVVKFPTGPGESETISTGKVITHGAWFFPDGHRMLLLGAEGSGHALRLWEMDGEHGTPRSFTPEGVSFRWRGCISPDGRQVVALDPDGKPTIYQVADGKATLIPGALPGENGVQWTQDEKSLLLGRVGLPNEVFLIDLATGGRKLFHTYTLSDTAGLVDTAPPNLSADLKSYVYSYTRITSDLYVVEGLR
jgi:eukaryotic-like serine/threonine-protein kinase